MWQAVAKSFGATRVGHLEGFGAAGASGPVSLLRLLHDPSGDGGAVTVRRGGAVCEFDATRMPFCTHADAELDRLVATVARGEVAADLNCGVGQFTTALLQGGAAHVHAFTADPVAAGCVAHGVELTSGGGDPCTVYTSTE